MLNHRSIAKGGLALSTKMKLRQLMAADLVAAMGLSYVYKHLLSASVLTHTPPAT